MVDRGNRMSMNTHLRFGFKLTRKVLILKTFGKSFFLEQPVHHEKAASSPHPERLTRTVEQDESEESWFSKSIAS
jgi:hypothetical protein